MVRKFPVTKVVHPKGQITQTMRIESSLLKEDFWYFFLLGQSEMNLLGQEVKRLFVDPVFLDRKVRRDLRDLAVEIIDKPNQILFCDNPTVDRHRVEIVVVKQEPGFGKIPQRKWESHSYHKKELLQNLQNTVVMSCSTLTLEVLEEAFQKFHQKDARVSEVHISENLLLQISTLSGYVGEMPKSLWDAEIKPLACMNIVCLTSEELDYSVQILVGQASDLHLFPTSHYLSMDITKNREVEEKVEKEMTNRATQIFVRKQGIKHLTPDLEIYSDAIWDLCHEEEGFIEAFYVTPGIASLWKESWPTVWNPRKLWGSPILAIQSEVEQVIVHTTDYSEVWIFTFGESFESAFWTEKDEFISHLEKLRGKTPEPEVPTDLEDQLFQCKPTMNRKTISKMDLTIPEGFPTEEHFVYVEKVFQDNEITPGSLILSIKDLVLLTELIKERSHIWKGSFSPSKESGGTLEFHGVSSEGEKLVVFLTYQTKDSIVSPESFQFLEKIMLRQQATILKLQGRGVVIPE